MKRNSGSGTSRIGFGHESVGRCNRMTLYRNHGIVHPTMKNVISYLDSAGQRATSQERRIVRRPNLKKFLAGNLNSYTAFRHIQILTIDRCHVALPV